MYCKIQDALPCVLYGKYYKGKIYFATAKKYFAWFLIAVHFLESVKLLAINLAHDGQSRFYLGEVHFSNSAVQNYFNSALVISFLGCANNFVHFYLMNKYGGHHFSFLDIYFREPHQVQALFNLPLFQFDRHVRNARKLFKVSTSIKNFLLLFYTIPILLNLRSSYDNLGPVFFVIFSFPCSLNSNLVFILSAQTYRDTLILFFNYVSFLGLRIQTLCWRLNPVRQFANVREHSMHLLRCLHKHNKILRDFYDSHMLFKLAPSFYTVPGTLLSTLLLYFGCFIYSNSGLKQLFIIIAAMLMVFAVSSPIAYMNSLFMEETRTLDQCWYSLMARTKGNLNMKVKVLGTLSLQQKHHQLSYTFNDMFSFNNNYMVEIIINSITTIMLIYQSQSN